MADLTPRERFLPFLLDRLTDDQSEQARESRERNVFSPRQLKEALLRDLSNLLNTQAPRAADGINEFTQVPTSVLNYGIPDLAGTTASALVPSAFERGILRAIQTFEPRLRKQSVSVRLLPRENMVSPNVVALEIRGEIIGTPMPDSLYIKTEMDLENGLLKGTHG